MSSVERIYIDADIYFSEILSEMVHAKKSIYIETYIFDQDQLGFRVLAALTEAAARGLQVQLLIDGVGSSHWTFRDAEIYRAKGIELKFFHPLVWQKLPSNIWGSLTFKKIVTGFSKANHRNHRKICIIDERVLFICSMNVSDRHLKSVRGSLAWRDTGVRVEGDAVQTHLTSCQQTWKYPHHYFGKRWAYVRRQKKRSHNEILRLIRFSNKQIWITNPYFVPDFKLAKALFRAARFGVDVKILVPMRSDIVGLKFAMQGFYAALLKYGCQIFEYTPSILHAKILIVDEWASVGSTNLDDRSIFYNLEADAVLAKSENVQLVKQQFLDDLKVSKQIFLDEWKKRPWHQRVLQRFFLIFRGVF